MNKKNSNFSNLIIQNEKKIKIINKDFNKLLAKNFSLKLDKVLI